MAQGRTISQTTAHPAADHGADWQQSLRRQTDFFLDGLKSSTWTDGHTQLALGH